MQTVLASQILNASPDAVLVTDADDIVVAANARVRDLFGIDPEHWIGRSIDIGLPVRLREQRSAMRAALRRGDSPEWAGVDHEIYGLHRDGHEFPVEARLAVFEDADGNGLIISTLRDASVRHSREIRLPQILDASINEIYQFDASTLRFVDVNLPARRNLGYSMDELRQLTPVDIKPAYTVARFEPILAPLRDAAGQSVVFYTEHKRKDGTRYPVEVHLQYRAQGGRPLFIAVILDTAEQQQTLAALRASEARFRETTQGMPFIVWSHDAAGAQDFVNDRFCEVFGVRLEDMGTDRWRILIHPDDEVAYTSAFANSIAEKAPFRAPCRARVADGSWRRFESFGRPRWSESGEFLGLIGSSVDVTEQHDAEQRVLASEERYRALIEVTAAIVWTTDASGAFVEPQPAWSRFTGQTDSQLAGFGWIQAVHPEDRKAIMSGWRKALANPTPYLNEGRLWHVESQTWRRFVVRAAPLGVEGDSVREWVGMCLDVEEQARLQDERARLSALVENSPDLIWICDLDLEPVYINPAGRKMLGIDACEALGSDQLFKFLSSEDRQRVATEFMPAVLRDGAGAAEMRFRDIRTGAPGWLQSRAFLVHDTAGKPIAYATISQDITGRRDMEHDLRRYADDLAQADQRKNEFLATLAHELRNPLAPLRNGIAVLARNGSDRDRRRETLEMLRRQTDHMVQLVDDLLDLSRITRGTIELRLARLDIMDAVRDAIEVAQPHFAAAAIKLTVCAPNASLMVDGDRVRLTQVIGNLLHNAAKFTERGGQVRVSVGQRDSRVAVSVVDNGIGIDPKQINGLFTMFNQIFASNRSQQGLGIGLALAKNLVELHHGSIEALSEGEGCGSEFRVYLPLADEVPDHAEPANRQAPEPSPGQRVLIVDDNEDAALSLAMLLELDGYQTHAVFNGAEALEAGANFKPDVVLLDIGMPEMDGYEVAVRMRALSTPVSPRLVALTGWGQDEDRQKSRDAGFDAHLVKPVAQEELAEVLASFRAGPENGL